MKNMLMAFTILLFIGGVLEQADAQSMIKDNVRGTKKGKRADQKAASPRISPQQRSSPLPAGTMSNIYRRQLADALSMVRQGQYQQAAPILHGLSRRPEFESERMQIKYILGVSLMEMKLYQISAFQFVDVIRNGKSRWVNSAIEKLSVVADALGDDTLLNYAVTKVQIDQFPANQRDIIYFRLGEIKVKNSQFAEAADLFSRVSSSSRYATPALFNRGLAFLELNKTNEALSIFGSIRNARAGAAVTDTNRVAAELAIARTYYQAQDWENAIRVYRNIPRDTDFWHDSLFEQTWADLRGAKFRSTLSHLHSLHSPYYEDFWVPESLIVRSIVYLFICKFDETKKTLALFDKKYAPLQGMMQRFMNSKDPTIYFSELETAMQVKNERKTADSLRLTLIVSNAILAKGDIKRSMEYLRNLNEEKKRLETLQTVFRSPLGSYGNKVLGNRYKNTKITIGEKARVHMLALINELQDLSEQTGFIRYETINGRKELLRKKIAGKDSAVQLDESVDREFFVQNGFEYWPFDGEYWLDEIGNYHYVGQQSCE
jgi:tetratricopeptide (TPR) repeat protein